MTPMLSIAIPSVLVAAVPVHAQSKLYEGKLKDILK